MPVNRNALIRYKTIDACLRNKYRKWTLEDLIEACSEALYDYEGIDKGVSKRTVQSDIQIMRSDKLGYNAPIVVTDKKFYAYEDASYSITNIPITDADLSKLNEVVDILKQFKGFSYFQEMTGMIQRLEDKVWSSQHNSEPIVLLETNDSLRGIENLDPLYQAILNKQVVSIKYQSFKARFPNDINFHPYLLKEYRNRWFLLGRKSAKIPLMTLALDRILEIKVNDEIIFIENKDFVPSQYFHDVIGVTVNMGQAPEKVRLKVDRRNAPYVITKPLHHSQKVVAKSDLGIEIELLVQHNFELEKEILSFGESMAVIYPKRLKDSITERIQLAARKYNFEFGKDQISSFGKKGTFVLEDVYKVKEVKKMSALLHKYFTKKSNASSHVYSIRNLFQEIPELKELTINENLKTVLSGFEKKYFVSKALFFDKPVGSNWYVTWHQDTTINVKSKIDTEGYFGWTKKGELYGVCPPEEVLHDTITVRIHLDDTDDENGALKVLPGSHKRRFTDDEVGLITESSVPAVCEVQAGGIHLMKPLLLHASSKTINSRSRRVIHLEFNSMELPNGLEWGERINMDHMTG